MPLRRWWLILLRHLLSDIVANLYDTTHTDSTGRVCLAAVAICAYLRAKRLLQSLSPEAFLKLATKFPEKDQGVFPSVRGYSDVIYFTQLQKQSVRLSNTFKRQSFTAISSVGLHFTFSASSFASG